MSLFIEICRNVMFCIILWSEVVSFWDINLKVQKMYKGDSKMFASFLTIGQVIANESRLLVVGNLVQTSEEVQKTIHCELSMPDRYLKFSGYM